MCLTTVQWEQCRCFNYKHRNLISSPYTLLTINLVYCHTLIYILEAVQTLNTSFISYTAVATFKARRDCNSWCTLWLLPHLNDCTRVSQASRVKEHKWSWNVLSFFFFKLKVIRVSQEGKSQSGINIDFRLNKIWRNRQGDYVSEALSWRIQFPL